MDEKYKAYKEECKQFVDEFAQHKKLIFTYVRRKDKRKKGIVVGFKSNNNVMLGVSLCNDRDKFDKFVGIKKAIQHAVPITEEKPEDLDGFINNITGQFHHSARSTVFKVARRAVSYFTKKADSSNG